MSTTKTVHQSRWGYHPVDHNEFLRLKEAHKLFLQALRQSRKNDRWIAKDEQNRSGEEPKLPAVYVTINTYLNVLNEYRNARYPVNSPEEVRPISLYFNFESDLKRLQG